MLLLVIAALLAPAVTVIPALATWHWVGMIAVALTASCLPDTVSTPTFDSSVGVASLLGVLLGDVSMQRLWPKLGVFFLGEPAVSTQVHARMT